MTRINCGIPPEDLSQKHLLAEHREIIRIPNQVSKGRYHLKDQPLKFTLGKGHVKFFYTRLGFLYKRYEEIYKECIKRGYNVKYYGSAWDRVPAEFMGDYTPTEHDIEIVKDRIKDRINGIKYIP